MCRWSDKGGVWAPNDLIAPVEENTRIMGCGVAAAQYADMWAETAHGSFRAFYALPRRLCWLALQHAEFE